MCCLSALFVYLPVRLRVTQSVCQVAFLSVSLRVCSWVSVCVNSCVYPLASATFSSSDSSPFGPCSIRAAQAIGEFDSSNFLNFLIKADGG